MKKESKKHSKNEKGLKGKFAALEFISYFKTFVLAERLCATLEHKTDTHMDESAAA